MGDADITASDELRKARLEAVIESWEPTNDTFEDDGSMDGVTPGERWLLVQYNGGRAPNEKWIATFDKLSELLHYAANDDEWEPDAIYDLDSGLRFEPVRQVILGAPVGWIGVDPEQWITRDEIVEALRDAERNDSAADAVEFVGTLIGWEASADDVLRAEKRAELTERRKALAAQLAAAGGRGVDLAEEIDRLDEQLEQLEPEDEDSRP